MGLAKYVEDVERRRDDLSHFIDFIDRRGEQTRSELEIRQLSKKLREHAQEFLELFSAVTDITKNDRLDIARQNHQLRKQVSDLQGKILDQKRIEEIQSWVVQSVAAERSSIAREVEQEYRSRQSATVKSLKNELEAQRKALSSLRQELERCREEKSNLIKGYGKQASSSLSSNKIGTTFVPNLVLKKKAKEVKKPKSSKRKKQKTKKLKRPPKKLAPLSKNIKDFKPKSN